MKQLFIVVLGVVFSVVAYGQDNDSDDEIKNDVVRFKKMIKSGDKAKLAQKVVYPFNRRYPVPDIMDATEFIRRYDEVFDEQIIRSILKSKPEDWGAMGWHGIVYGDIWLEYGGKLKAINHETSTGQKVWLQYAQKDRENVHASLRTFAKAALILETKKYRVRIDEMGNGTYRYASWTLPKKMNEPPDIIVENGDIGGLSHNYEFRFKNGNYQYVCNIISGGDEEASWDQAYLYVYRGTKEERLLEQEAVKLYN